MEFEYVLFQKHHKQYEALKIKHYNNGSTVEEPLRTTSDVIDNINNLYTYSTTSSYNFSNAYKYLYKEIFNNLNYKIIVFKNEISFYKIAKDYKCILQISHLKALFEWHKHFIKIKKKNDISVIGVE